MIDEKTHIYHGNGTKDLGRRNELMLEQSFLGGAHSIRLCCYGRIQSGARGSGDTDPPEKSQVLRNTGTNPPKDRSNLKYAVCLEGVWVLVAG